MGDSSVICNSLICDILENIVPRLYSLYLSLNPPHTHINPTRKSIRPTFVSLKRPASYPALCPDEKRARQDYDLVNQKVKHLGWYLVYLFVASTSLLTWNHLRIRAAIADGEFEVRDGGARPVATRRRECEVRMGAKDGAFPNIVNIIIHVVVCLPLQAAGGEAGRRE